MPNATLLRPRTLDKYGRKWQRGEEVWIDFQQAAKMRGDDRFKITGLKIKVEEDPDDQAPETEEKAPRRSQGRTRTVMDAPEATIVDTGDNKARGRPLLPGQHPAQRNTSTLEAPAAEVVHSDAQPGTSTLEPIAGGEPELISQAQPGTSTLEPPAVPSEGELWQDVTEPGKSEDEIKADAEKAEDPAAAEAEAAAHPQGKSEQQIAADAEAAKAKDAPKPATRRTTSKAKEPDVKMAAPAKKKGGVKITKKSAAPAKAPEPVVEKQEGGDQGDKTGGEGDADKKDGTTEGAVEV